MADFHVTTQKGAVLPSTRDDPPQPILVILYCQDHGRIGQRVRVRDGMRLGRASTVFAGEPFEDARMSRHHATVEVEDTGVYVVDGGSTNGTALNGDRIARALLRPGDVMQLGNTFFAYTIGDPDPPPRPDTLLLGSSPAIEALRKGLALVAPTSTTVLVTGEPGVGKRTVAREVHRLSRRRGPLVTVECGVGAPEEVERTLLGEVGPPVSLGGAPAGGALAEARGGTLLLVDVEMLSQRAQVRLLWALDELSRGYVAGGDDPVRLVATTRRVLEQQVLEGRFRDDLYARLIAWEVDVPPLRERSIDVGALLAHFTDRKVAAEGDEPTSATPEFVWAALEYPWPRNVPELQAAVETACVEASAGDGLLRLSPRVARLLSHRAADGAEGAEEETFAPPPEARKELLDVLEQYDFVISHVARHYGKHRQQVYRWLERFEIDVDALRDASGIR